jgi:uncharacterized OB-fold protein
MHFESTPGPSLPTLRRCTACGALRIYPKPLCAACHHDGAESATVSGFGKVYTFTVVHRPPTPELKPDAPYVIALVDLDEGVRAPARLKAPEGYAWRCGDRVRLAPVQAPYAVFEPQGDGP